jgi:hypothetical protein
MTEPSWNEAAEKKIDQERFPPPWKCEECGQPISSWDTWYCACGKRLCGTCFITPPHSFHINGEPIEKGKKEE